MRHVLLKATERERASLRALRLMPRRDARRAATRRA